MTFLEGLKKESAKTITGNGEVGYSTTLDNVLDYSLKVGNSRFLPNYDIKDAFDKSWKTDEVLTAKTLFHGRDILEGGGDKKFGRLGIKKIFDTINVEKYNTLFNLVVKYGSYKDLVLLLGQKSLTDIQVRYLVNFLNTQLSIALDKLDSGEKNNNELLVAKYLPTETTKSSFMKLAYSRIINTTKVKRKDYRKTVVRARKHLNLVETHLTNKDYESIDYSKVPSQAMLKYKNAFYRNDNDKINEHFNKLNSNDETIKESVKVNTKTLEPYQIVDKVLDKVNDFYYGIDDSDSENTVFYDTMWDNLPKLENSISALPIVDVSGSMYGLPMSVAVSLGIYLSENNNSEFKNHFFTFSENPTLIDISNDKGLTEKVKTVANSEWGMSTDLEKVFDTILNTTLNNPDYKVPEILVIISDMNFDQISSGWYSNGNKYNSTFFEKIKDRYSKHGLQVPFIVFWNVDGNAYGNNGVHPVVSTDKNVCEVSGFSKNIFKSIMTLDIDELQDYTPTKVLLNTLNSDRYDDIEKLFE
ncbi:RNA binding protein [Mammaliicoccus phage vB_MscM-PMS3]|nr:RNA binding protein [Mammaliicoccus phage vB_MscM-PMS3]